jgi:hypothetical protein
MQAACGLIKVGRSIDPEARRVALSHFIMEDLALVAVLPDRGKDEEAVHLKLKRFRRHIEWFSGTQVAREAVDGVLGLEKPCWPYPWQPKVAAELLSHLGFQRNRTYVLRRRRNVINSLKGGNIKWWTNSEICGATMGHPYLIIHMTRVDPTVVDRRTGEEFAVPDYLADHDAAATAGPPGWDWESEPGAMTPAQVVIAGLEARTKWERQQMAAEQEGADEDCLEQDDECPSPRLSFRS